ncbi:MAG: hypothetical protein ACNI3A_06470 [Desulfovibrio sp.]|uniref:hypothetical protein n=1 Tax=Desulfovibrio sp. 7SRBS1 TaxID=3378064 RepID=UPI003B40CA05
MNKIQLRQAGQKIRKQGGRKKQDRAVFPDTREFDFFEATPLACLYHRLQGPKRPRFDYSPNPGGSERYESKAEEKSKTVPYFLIREGLIFSKQRRWRAFITACKAQRGLGLITSPNPGGSERYESKAREKSKTVAYFLIREGLFFSKQRRWRAFITACKAQTGLSLITVQTQVAQKGTKARREKKARPWRMS